nr:mitochondrial import receptor subunit TOM20 homolog isoform X2 [Anser cygnoides]
MWKPSLERISIFRKRLLFSLCNAVSPNFRRDQGSCVSSDCRLYLFKHWQTKEDLILFCYPSYILHPFVWAVLGLKTALGNPIVKMKCLDSGFRKKKGSLQECVDFGFPGRKKQKLAKERAGLSKLPDLKDAEAVQKFFLEEIQLGEELLAQGEYEKGVDHLTNAIAVCGQPQQLLQVLQQTLPPPVFQMLLTKLPTISQRIVSAQCLAEDDVE